MVGSFSGGSFHRDGLFIASQLSHTRRLTCSGDLFGGVRVALCRRSFCVFVFGSTLSYDDFAD
jgi:hypothetical protein